MANKIDLTGKRFGRLVVLEQAEYHIDKRAEKQECGNASVIVGMKQ